MKLRTTLEGHAGPVLCVRFDREGRRIASGSRDRTIKIWSLRGKLERTIDAHAKGVDVLCFSADDELISGGADGGVSVWSWPKGVARLEIEAHEGPVYTLGVSRDGRLIASGGADETVALWSIDDGELVHRFDVGPRGMAFVFTSDGEHLVTGARGDTLRFWSLESGELVWEQDAGPGMVGAFEPDRSGEWVVSRGWRGPVTIWSTESWSYAGVLPIIEDGLCGAMLRPGHEQLVCAWDKHVGVFDATNGELLDEADAGSKQVNELDVSPDGRSVALACGDKRVRIWDL
jgi:WD40 repeat protein